jgi:hypothetical protein
VLVGSHLNAPLLQSYVDLPISSIDQTKNLSQSDLMDCKIITIEGGRKVFLLGCVGHGQCFKIQ